MSTTASKGQIRDQSIPLTDEQIAGLARLGDIGNQLGLLLDGPLAGPIASLTTQGGELYARYDVPAITQSVLEAADALHRAGWFAFIKDNAEFVAQSIETLEPLIRQWIDASGKVSTEKMKTDLKWLMELLSRGREISEFVQAQWSSDLAEYVVAGTQYVQQQELLPVMRDLVGLLTKLHQAGLYEKLGLVADYAGRIDEGVDVELLAGQMVHKIPPNSLALVKQVMGGAKEALEEVEAHEKEFGGLKGLLYLLRDKNVQKGLHIMATLPALLSENNKH